MSAGLEAVATDTDRLRAAADAGQFAAAKRAWLVAHLDYPRLGAAYDTFGNFNDEIDGRPNGLPWGSTIPAGPDSFESSSPSGKTSRRPRLRSQPTSVDAYVHQLVAAFPEETIPFNDLSLRTHEILENTLQFELTGETDQGSHTGLATAEANVQGTQMILGVITPLLEKREPHLVATLNSDLRGLTSLIRTYQLPDGPWTPVQSLSTTQREHLDGAMGSYLEAVSPVPDLLELPPEASNP